jgi:hypothetical protein
MADDSEIKTIVEATSELLKAVPVYQDALQPAAKEIGKALGTVGGIINVALAPLAAVVYGYDSIKDKLKQRLEKKMSDIPPDKIIKPPLQVVGPLLQKYVFVYESEDLSEMFINLLACAMNSEQTKNAHPSFVSIISEISTERFLPKLDIVAKVKTTENQEGYLPMYSNFTLLGEKAELQNPELTPSYLSNLERHMIIRCSTGMLQDSYTYERVYTPLEEHAFVKKMKELVLPNKVIEVRKGTIEITDFGKLFISAVL